MSEYAAPLRTRLLRILLLIVGALAVLSVAAHIMTERAVIAHLSGATGPESELQIYRLLTVGTWLQTAILGGLLALIAYFLILPMAKRVEKTEGALTEARAALEHTSRHDVLTGLPERHFFEELLTHSLAVGDRHGHAVAMLRIELDNFREANERLGTEACDRILAETGRVLRNLLRSADYVARIGGDEFAIVVPELRTVEGVGKLAERVRTELAPVLRENHEESPITCSIGVAIAWPGDGIDGETLLTRADHAMAEAKKHPGDAWRYHASAIQGMRDHLAVVG